MELTQAHGVIRSLSNGKDVRRNFISPLATVDTHSSHGVDGEPLVGIDSDTEETRVGVDQSLNIALLQVKQDRSIVEVGQVGHVLTAVVLGRVDLGDQFLLEGLSLSSPGLLEDLDHDLVAIGLLDDTLAELLLGVRNIARSLGIVGLLSNLLLDLVTDEQIWCWIRIISSLQLNLRSWHDEPSYASTVPGNDRSYEVIPSLISPYLTESSFVPRAARWLTA